MSIPVGLENLGNTCYVNSILQALASCDMFLETVIKTASNHRLLLDNQHNQHNHHDYTCLLCILQSYFLTFKHNKSHSYQNNSHHNSLSPLSFIQLLPIQLSPIFTQGVQQDAHEFLKLLLSSFDNTELVSVPISESSSSSRLSHLFTGSLANLIQCNICHTVSKKIDPFEGLDIGISKSSALSSAMDDFFGVEILQHENAYACETCKRKTRATKRLRLIPDSLPEILIIQFKRFTPYMTKIQHHVQFTLTINLRQFTTSDPSSSSNSSSGSSSNGNSNNLNPNYNNSGELPLMIYELTAVVVHIGQTMDSGHYIAYVRRGSRWYSADDSMVTPCRVEDVIDQQAYILFYQRNNNDIYTNASKLNGYIRKESSSHPRFSSFSSSSHRMENDDRRRVAIVTTENGNLSNQSMRQDNDSEIDNHQNHYYNTSINSNINNNSNNNSNNNNSNSNDNKMAGNRLSIDRYSVLRKRSISDASQNSITLYSETSLSTPSKQDRNSHISYSKGLSNSATIITTTTAASTSALMNKIQSNGKYDLKSDKKRRLTMSIYDTMDEYNSNQTIDASMKIIAQKEDSLRQPTLLKEQEYPKRRRLTSRMISSLIKSTRRAWNFVTTIIFNPFDGEQI